jgi:Fe-S-cluster-containing hydrogenase component 2
MGYPYSDALLELLAEMFTPREAQIALAIPNDLPPLDVVSADRIISRCDLSPQTVRDALQSLVERHLIYSRITADGVIGYALLQVGYGIPQTFFWGGREDSTARRMAKLVLNYFSVPTTGKIYGGVKTKSYKYSPVGASIDVAMQGVLPCEQIGPIVQQTTKIAVAHCPCRMSARLLGRTDCHHSLENCLKYDEMAEFVIDRGIARQISRDEAMQILEKSEREGLVHMVDNTQGQVKHTCCGDYCWNVGIIRRRKIPRDQLMAVYFIRQTELAECIGCGACADICPVDAVRMVDDLPVVDLDWCIGCGVCAVTCPADVIRISRRLNDFAPETFQALHQRIKKEKKALTK